MTNNVGASVGAKPGPFADLIADAAVVRQALDLRVHPIEMPDHRAHSHPDGAIPDRALAVVADLDAYGD